MLGCALFEKNNQKTEEAARGNWDKIITKGEEAPFSGVLVAEDSYRFYQQDSALFPHCEEKLRGAQTLCAEEPWFSYKNLIWLIFGAGLGYIAKDAIGSR